MGTAFFPGEKVKNVLPPRDNNTDLVGRFGAWLTADGAAIIGVAIPAIPALLGTIKLVGWVWSVFQDNFFLGILAIFVAIIALSIGYCVYYLAYIMVYVIFWLLGWICYNVWTLLATIVIVFLIWGFSTGVLTF